MKNSRLFNITLLIRQFILNCSYNVLRYVKQLWTSGASVIVRGNKSGAVFGSSKNVTDLSEGAEGKINGKNTSKSFLAVQNYNTLPQPLRQILEKNL